MADHDVVIAGFGYAGAAAAIAAHDAGARVLLLEKGASPGGISVCSAGGLRITDDRSAALRYLVATNAGTTPEPVLQTLADGMAALPETAGALCEAVGAKLGLRASPANYPLPGHDSFGFAYVDELPDFDPAEAYPSVRGSAAGAMLFEVMRRNVAMRSGIEVRLSTPVERLLVENGEVQGIIAGGERIPAARSVVLACGGFESDPELQRQFWPVQPVLSAAVRFNTGDGLRMGQSAGAALWHMWHFHGSYGFRHPDPAYPFGIRLKRLPDWNPAEGLREGVAMAWILLDQGGNRFMNEYEPYMQDTGHRPLAAYDPVSQSLPRVPALLVVDRAGRERYPLSAPTWHDDEVAARYGKATPRDFDRDILIEADSIARLAARFGIDGGSAEAAVMRWNAACEAGRDTDFGRPPGSMSPIVEAPFSGAAIWPIVSNTQGGLVHDERQRVLDAHGASIGGLYVAGELGSVFGHLYMSGGNIAECFVGGSIAGHEAAAGERTTL